ncbi:glycosyltransferase family 4 protein [Patescibacteria group bacterium]
MLTPYLPYPLLSGGQIRTYNLLKNLKSKHDITLFAYIRKDSERKHIKELEKYCHKVRVFKRRPAWDLRNILFAGTSSYPFLVSIYRSKHFEEEIRKELDNNNYDLIHAETFYMMPNIPKTATPTILAEQTIEYDAYLQYTKNTKIWPAKPLLYLDVSKIKRWETHYWKNASRLITMSEDDKHAIQNHLKKEMPIDVVANGVDTDLFAKTDKRKLPENPTVLFVGTFKWLPNIDAVELLVEKVWPHVIKNLKHARLLIVGFSPNDKIKLYGDDPTITVRGDVEDIRDAYSQAHALLAPIRSGKGTRYKILEAMATSTPIVATNLAVEGIGIKNGEHALMADSPEELAKSTIKLLSDKNLQQKLANNSRELVTKNYNWPAISRDLDRVYSEVGSK